MSAIVGIAGLQLYDQMQSKLAELSLLLQIKKQLFVAGIFYQNYIKKYITPKYLTRRLRTLFNNGTH